MQIKVELSNSHVHLDAETRDILFGKDYEFTCHKVLGPKAFAAKETVTIIGPKKNLEGLRVLLPLRKHTQVELLRSECIKAGIQAPCLESGDYNSLGPCTIQGPAGTVTLENGCMITQRHIHLTPETAEKIGLKEHQLVTVRGGERMTSFEDCSIHFNITDVIHLDFDEGNAAALKNGDLMEVIP